jgi:hypothetical protein
MLPGKPEGEVGVADSKLKITTQVCTLLPSWERGGASSEGDEVIPQIDQAAKSGRAPLLVAVLYFPCCWPLYRLILGNM